MTNAYRQEIEAIQSEQRAESLNALVERLLELAELLRRDGPENGMRANICVHAAQEIERLREALAKERA